MSAVMAQSKIHAFEEAGLGKAPFKCVQVYWSQTLRACDFCSTCIMEVCVIRSSDNRTFIVGNQCVFKTGDRGLIDLVKREVNALRARMRKEKDAARVASAKELLNNNQVKESLAAQPHPIAYWAEQGRTLLSYVEWLMENGGMSGQVRAAKMIESAQQTLTAISI
jgi:hypothetical protein